MPTLTPGEILAALTAGTFAALLGTSEDDAVECKAAPYRTGDERECIELAKDISGLANANGGLILIGARTQRAQDSREDVIRAYQSSTETCLIQSSIRRFSPRRSTPR
jgi:hypothetical protein